MEKQSENLKALIEKKTVLTFKWMLIVWILIMNGIIAAIGFKYGWLIFISNIMMFTMGEGTPVKKFVSVEAGGFVGLLFTVFLMIVHSKLSAAGMGAIPALLIPLAVILFFLIICSGKWPWLFNNTGFAYLTVATAAGNLALFVSDMRMHFIGFIIGSLIFNAVSLLLLKTAQIIVVKRYKDSLPQQSE